MVSRMLVLLVGLVLVLPSLAGWFVGGLECSLRFVVGRGSVGGFACRFKCISA